MPSRKQRRPFNVGTSVVNKNRTPWSRLVDRSVDCKCTIRKRKGEGKKRMDCGRLINEKAAKLSLETSTQRYALPVWVSSVRCPCRRVAVGSDAMKEG